MAFPLPETIIPEGQAGETLDHDKAHQDIHKLLNNNINAQAGTTYTLVLADAGKIIELTSASAVNVTVPPNPSVAFPIGTVIEIVRIGAGTVTLVQGSGVTILTSISLVLRAQNSSAILRKRSTDGWIVAGDLA